METIKTQGVAIPRLGFGREARGTVRHDKGLARLGGTRRQHLEVGKDWTS
jgi:hypothetical protein